MARATSRPDQSSKKAQDDKGRGSFTELVIIVVVALGLALLIQAVLVKPFRIPSPSMVPTLAVGQRVLVDRVSFRFSDPHRGDVVVFKPPAGAARAEAVGAAQCGEPRAPDNGQPCPRGTPERSDDNFIKRIVGEPGDRLKVVRNRVYINGQPQKEPYVEPGSHECMKEEQPTCDLETEMTVPPDHFFMMGDNRGESSDSREWGPVPKDWIVGNAFFTYWPPKKIGGL
jgi:signal peptidase I